MTIKNAARYALCRKCADSARAIEESPDKDLPEKSTDYTIYEGHIIAKNDLLRRDTFSLCKGHKIV